MVAMVAVLLTLPACDSNSDRPELATTDPPVVTIPTAAPDTIPMADPPPTAVPAAIPATTASAPAADTPPTVHTANRHRNEHIEYLRTHIVLLQRADRGATITAPMFDGPSDNVETRAVSEGYRFTYPDPRGSQTFYLQTILLDGIVIEYESTRRPAGENRVEHDVGIFMLGWINKFDNTLASPALTPRDRAEMTADLIRRIANADADNQVTDLNCRTIDALRDHDSDLVNALREEYAAPASGRTMDVTRNSVILRALGYLGTPLARQALVEIACLDEEKQFGAAHTLGQRAVKALARCSKDSDDFAQVLLESPTTDTRDAAAYALHGLPLSEKAIHALVSRLPSSSWSDHYSVSHAFGRDPSDAHVALKVRILLNNYPALVGGIDDAERVPSPLTCTPTDMARASYIGALSDMPGATEELERRLTEAVGEEREVLLLALGRRNVAAVRPELLKLITDSPDGFLRMNAVNALYHLATDDDNPLLQRLAETDPYEQIGVSRTGQDQTVFPVRAAANEVLNRLEKEKR